MNPLITVIIPTYKNNGGLNKTIKSVVNQTYKNIEIIIVDDNNNDEFRKETEIIVSNFLSDNRIKYIKHESNKNGSAARNTGIKASNGEYIAFLDDDDNFKEDKIEKQIKYLIHKNFDCVYCRRISHNILSNLPINKEGNLSEDLLLLKSQLQTSLLLFKKSVLIELNGFDESFLRHQDYEIMLRFFNKGFKIGFVEDTYVDIGNQGQNRIFGRKMYEIKNQFLNQFSESIDSIELSKKGFKKQVLLKHYSSLFIALVKGREFKLAIEIYKKYLSNLDRKSVV